MSKIKDLRILILMLSAAFGLLAGCSDVSVKKAVENERKNIILSELVNMRRTDSGMAGLQSVELLTFKSQPIYSINRSSTEPAKTGIDNSQITTMYDGFGNKTETRCLENDPLLRCIVLKTTVAGQKQAIVYGQNGEVKRLPDEALDKLMISAASNIAAAAEIYEQPKIEQTKVEPVIFQTVEPVTQYNQYVAAPTPTPETIAAAQNNQIVEAVKPEQKPETSVKPEIKPETKPETVTNIAAAPPTKIKVDSLWLNNAPPKKKPQP